MVCRVGHENDPVERMRHSCAHVMADAVTTLFPGTKVTIGPCIDTGFYYDFDIARAFTPEDLQEIEEKMREIVKANLPFARKELPKKEVVEFFEKRGEKYKVEIIREIPEGEPISLYQHGSFVDLCKGPHVACTGEIKAFKLLHAAGSYWRGDEKRERLQRIYGTAFATQKELDEFVVRLEEAQKRDHRRLGRELDLFSFHPEAPASPFFHPKGALVYGLMIDYLRELYKTEGYQEVITPEILDLTLWQKSGHLDHFKENMFFTTVEEREMAVKPMNCPGHCLMFGEKNWSYRELPVRFADFGRLHRFERSGVTHGLTRIRTFVQDDAHIYCTPDQIEGEIGAFLKLTKKVYADFGFSEVLVALATRPDHFIGTPAQWDHAEKILKESLQHSGLSFKLNPGEGAFYGPKIEFQVKDALERSWQLGTLQVDYSMPERFNLSYIGQNGQKARPVMLHRAILGSIERFYGILLEHNAGRFPFWLSPLHILVIPISEGQQESAKGTAESLQKEGFRVEVDGRNEKLGLKIREAQLKKVPYMGVVGEREVKSKTIGLRHWKEGDLGAQSLEVVIKRLQKELGLRV